MRILWAFLLLANIAVAQEVKLPETLSGQVGEPITVKAETDGTIVRWYVVDNGLFMIDPELLKSTKAISVWSLKPGKYRLICWTAKKDTPSQPAQTMILVGNVPPGPDPGPDPDPDPDPEPDLTNFSKRVLALANAVNNKTEAKQIAENYASIISSISAGAYKALDFEAARAKIVGDVYQLNHKVSEGNIAWNDFFKALGDEVTELDKQGKLNTVEQIKTMFQEIQAGLEASL